MYDDVAKAHVCIHKRTSDTLIPGSCTDKMALIATYRELYQREIIGNSAPVVLRPDGIAIEFPSVAFCIERSIRLAVQVGGAVIIYPKTVLYAEEWIKFVEVCRIIYVNGVSFTPVILLHQ